LAIRNAFFNKLLDIGLQVFEHFQKKVIISE